MQDAFVKSNPNVSFVHRSEVNASSPSELKDRLRPTRPGYIDGQRVKENIVDNTESERFHPFFQQPRHIVDLTCYPFEA